MRPRRNQAIALVVLSFFVFQLSRVYLIPTIQAFYICPYTQVWTSQTAPPNNTAQSSSTTEDIADDSLPPSQDDPTSIRGCKDTFDGIGLTPVQPFGAPSTVASIAPETNEAIFSSSVDSGPESYLPVPFLPPRLS